MRSLSLPILASSIVLFAATACVDKGSSGTKVDPAYVKANVLAEAPAIPNKVAVDFAGKVQYLGNELHTKVLTPGGAASVTHYWKVIEPPGSEWKVFAHLNGNRGEWLNLDATDMRKGYPTKDWKAGDVIRDEQKFTLPGNWKSTKAVLSVGLYQKGGHGIDARMDIVSGPKDSEKRAAVANFQIQGGATTPGKATRYSVRKASGPITIDGKADESSWQMAPMSPKFSAAEGGPKVVGDATARLLWDDEYLYAFVQVSDSDVYSQFKERDDTLWKEDVVELFIDADRNRRGYVELQVNPNNAHFDAWFPNTRGQKHFFDWNSQMKSAVVVHGTADKQGDTDEGWDVEIAIPLADVKGQNEAMAIKIPPALGDSWRLNIIRGDKPKGKSLSASSWNPITIQDFHALDRMLTIVFADSDGKTGTAPERTLNATAPEPVRPTTEEERKSMSTAPSSAKPVPVSGSQLRELKLKAIKEREAKADEVAKPMTREERLLDGKTRK